MGDMLIVAIQNMDIQSMDIQNLASNESETVSSAAVLWIRIRLPNTEPDPHM